MYGEYLMNGVTRGLVLRSRGFLASKNERCVPEVADYNLERDEVAALLRRWGLPVQPGLRGNLWQGCGLASSTAASRIYLTAMGVPDMRPLMMKVDRVLHGFEPSGLDVECILRQRDGLYGDKVWQDVEVSTPARTLVSFPKEGLRTLGDILAVLEKATERLARLADAMTARVLSERFLPFAEMVEYAGALAALRIYSSTAQEFVEWSLAAGLAAKGVGGLYDKALLLLWPDHANEALYSRVWQEAVRRGALRWAPESGPDSFVLPPKA